MNDDTEMKGNERKTGRPTFVALCGHAFQSDPEFFPQVEYHGKTIYLCTSVCLDAFLADPDRFYVSHRKKYIKNDGDKFIGNGVTMLEPRKPIQYFQVDARRNEPIGGSTIVETPVSLSVNGEAWVSFMCTPVLLEAMAIGFHSNEGVIDSMDEVVDVRLCEHGDNVDMWLNHPVEKPAGWTRTSGVPAG